MRLLNTDCRPPSEFIQTKVALSEYCTATQHAYAFGERLIRRSACAADMFEMLVFDTDGRIAVESMCLPSDRIWSSYGSHEWLSMSAGPLNSITDCERAVQNKRYASHQAYSRAQETISYRLHAMSWTTEKV